MSTLLWSQVQNKFILNLASTFWIKITISIFLFLSKVIVNIPTTGGPVGSSGIVRG
jgi:hypothetical protein